MGFERQELREIRAELEKAIDTHQQIKMAQNGDLNKYVFNVGNCSYTDSKATFKLEVTIKGVTLSRCPAEYQDERNCANCKLCANPNRTSIVVFTAHGSTKNKVGKTEQGGCYGTNGPVAWAWKKTMNKTNLILS